MEFFVTLNALKLELNRWFQANYPKSLMLLLWPLLSLTAVAQDVSLDWVHQINAGHYYGSGRNVTLDDNGNMYVTGCFYGTSDFDPTSSTFNMTSNNFNTYVLKLDTAAAFVWAKMFTNNYNYSSDLAIDSDGNVYVSGYFAGSVDFDPSSGTHTKTASGFDGYLAKLSSNGELAWVKTWEGSGNQNLISIDIDGDDNIYAVGRNVGAMDLHPGSATVSMSSSNWEMFVVKLDSSGAYQWGQRTNTTNIVLNNHLTFYRNVDIAASEAGKVYITGTFQGSMDFDFGTGTQVLGSSGGYDVFLLKMDSTGAYDWAHKFGGSGTDWWGRVTLDQQENVYFTGSYSGNVDYDPGSSNAFINQGSARNVVAVKLDSAANFEWATYLSGGSASYSHHLHVDDYGGLYIAGGTTASTDFDSSSSTASESGSFIAKYNSTGGFVWVKRLLAYGIESMRVEGVTVDNGNNVYSTGYFIGTHDFDPHPTNTYNMTHQGGSNYKDFFIHKMKSECTPTIDTVTVDTCGSYTWINSLTYTTSTNTPSVTYTSASGCDSIVRLDLTIHPTSLTNLADTACDSYLWVNTGATYTSSGTYYDTLSNAAGCDSIVALNLVIHYSNASSQTEVACDSFSWSANNQTYTTSGTYVDTLTNAAGCDSVVTLNLTVNYSNTGTQTEVACDSYTWSANNQTYTSSGSYVDTLTNASGCDSVVTLNLTVNYSNTGTQTEVACDSFIWIANNQTYTTSGTYVDTLTNASGCDSVVTLNLTVHYSDSETQTEVACDSFTWVANNQTYTTSGVYIDTLTNASGCDSIVTLNLTVNHSNTGSQTEVACDSYTWSANNQTYTASGTYVDTLTNASGCDSVVTLNLTVNYSDTGSQTVVACDSYTWSANNQTYTASGVYLDTISTALGCDSMVTLNLTVNYSNTGSQTEVVCDSFAWPANNVTYTTSGVYLDTLTNASGCDSVVTLNLTVNHSNTGTQTEVACDSYTWSANNQTYTTSGTYVDTLTNAAGCDSVVTLNLTVNYSDTGSQTVVACDIYTWSANNQTYTTSGVYLDTISTALGCDSMVTLNLTVNYSDTGSQTEVVCDSFTWSANNVTYTTSGVYMDTLTTSTGCDSVVALYLSVNYSDSTNITEVVCDSYTWAVNNETYTTSGVYMDTLSNTTGCDSIVTLFLTVNYSDSSSQTEVVCNSYTWSANNQTYTASGVYVDTISSTSGCDSVVTLDLTVHYSDTSWQTEVACDSYTWSANNTTYTSSGTYVDTLATTNGCDSVVWLDLTILESKTSEVEVYACDSFELPGGSMTTSSGTYIDTIVNASGCDSVVTTTLHISTLSGDTDCNGEYNGNEIAGDENGDGVISFPEIAGDTDGNGVIDGDEIAGDINGDGVIGSGEIAGDLNGDGIINNDEVEGDANGDGVADNIGIAETAAMDVKVFPNPTTGTLTIELAQHTTDLRLRLYSIAGSLIDEVRFGESGRQLNYTFDVPAGTYLLELSSPTMQATQKRVIKL